MIITSIDLVTMINTDTMTLSVAVTDCLTALRNANRGLAQLRWYSLSLFIGNTYKITYLTFHAELYISHIWRLLLGLSCLVLVCNIVMAPTFIYDFRCSCTMKQAHLGLFNVYLGQNCMQIP